MSSEPPEEHVRKIIIAVDTSPNSLAALRVAADIAAHLDAEILGLYVEDANLLQFSNFPFARQVSFYSATIRQLDREQVERQLRAQANEAQRILRELARRRGLRSSFVVSRGLVTTEVLNTSGEGDLLVIGRTGWSRRRHLGSTARLIISQSARHTLVMPEGASMSAPVGVVYDGTEASMRALHLADKLLKGVDGGLAIWILAADIHQAREYQKTIDEWVKQKDRQAEFRWLLGPESRRLGDVIRREQIGTLILPAPVEALAIEDLLVFMDAVNIPVLLVR